MSTDATLQAALAFVDAYVDNELELNALDDISALPVASDDELERLLADLESSLSPRSDSIAPTTATTPLPIATGPKQRVTPSQQLKALKATAAGLEKELDELKRAKMTPEVAVRSSSSPVTPPARSHSRLADALDAACSPCSSTLVKCPRPLTPLNDAMLEEQMKQKLANMYDDIDRIFVGARFHERRHLLERRHDEASGGIVTEMIETRRLPFRYQATSDVLFDMAVNHPDKQRVLLKEEIDEDNGWISRVFERSIQLPNGASGLVRSTTVARRIIESKRAIHLCYMYIEPVEVDNKRLGGVRLCVSLWDMMEPASDDSAATIKLSYGVRAPEIVDNNVPPENIQQGLALLNRFFHMKGKLTSEVKSQMLENRLIEGVAALKLSGENTEQP
ncbi:hypothetical protein Poli38472_011853 [Pythium oligandrum]|uniref:START domain-containing protein n=1 Tax=Pythium oligandrum TaxID=41045 RepID=A0A8K1C8K4_PYTOL|nr:hypothetical protein Poli38472_011853 [Pythium oligandrum]|eukprot:TMW58265.1 hypothetical protein Poli38472_011853 [Pythium oligandrum]